MAEDKKKNLYMKIAQRAYALYAARGYKHGHHTEDWLKAEKEVMAGEAKKGKKGK